MPDVYEMFRAADRIVLRQEGVGSYPRSDVSGTRYVLVHPALDAETYLACAGFIEMLAGRPASVEIGNVVFDRQGSNLDPVVWKEGEFPYREIIYEKRGPRPSTADDD